MAELSKIFKSNELYEAWRDNKDIPSNVLAVVLDETGNDVEKVAFGTNNIDGQYQTYEVEKGQEPTGTYSIDSNGKYYVPQYEYVDVNVNYPVLMYQIQYDQIGTILPYDFTAKRINDYTLENGKAKVKIIFKFKNTQQSEFNFDAYKNTLGYSNNGYYYTFTWTGEDTATGELTGTALIDYAIDNYIEINFVGDMLALFFVNIN